VGIKQPSLLKTFTSRFIPEATPEHEQWFDELQRVSTSPENAARLLERGAEIDVRPLLPQIKAPTLVYTAIATALCLRSAAARCRRDPWRAVRLAAERESPHARG
jgi:hypothetical protein